MSPINRRKFLKIVGLAAAGMAGCTILGPILTDGSDKKRPNLLILHTDQQRWQTVSAYGAGEISTPHIDSLAHEGALFTNFFTNHAICTASRGCLLTGRYPWAHGAWKNNIPLNRNEVTLAHVLGKNGYDTGYAGKWHLDGAAKPGWVAPDRSMGFVDSRFMFNRGHWKGMKDRPSGHPKVSGPILGDEESFTTDWLANKAIDFIKKDRSGPFFYMVSFPDPHQPFSVRPPYDTMFSPDDMVLPKTLRQNSSDKPGWARKEDLIHGKTEGEKEQWLRKTKAHYLGQVKCIDDNVGRILDALRDTGQLDNTIVVFTTDHGEFMGEHGLMYKSRAYETAFRLPMLIRWPAAIPKGLVVDNVMSTVDFMPTVLSLMGYAGSGREQGRDGSDLLKGGKSKWVDEAFIHMKADRSYLGIWTPRWELAYAKGSDAVLFDRLNDPDQEHNLFNDSKYRSVVKDLTGRIIQHCEEVGDDEVQWLKAE